MLVISTNKPTLYGVGYLDNATKEQRLLFRSIWSGMFRRCYNKNYKEYCRYGAKGVTVDARWHSLRNFADDAVKLPGYSGDAFRAGKLSIDKDKLCSSDIKVYSKDTCCFLTPREQQQYLSGIVAARKFIAIDKDGVETEHTGIRLFAYENNLDSASIHQCLNGKRKHYKGWKFRAV